MQLSVNQSTTMRWTFDEDLIFYSNNGIKSAGFSLSKIDEFGISKAVELQSELDINASSLGTVGFHTDISGPTLMDQVCAAESAIRIAAEVNAECLIVHTGGPGRHLKKNRFCVAKKAIDLLLPFAEEFGIALAIEPMSPDSRTKTLFSHGLGDCIQLVREYSSESLGLAVDLFHVGNRLFNKDLEFVFPNIQLIQIADYVQQDVIRNRCPLGRGEVRIHQVWDCLQRANYNGPLEVELYGELFDYCPYESVIQDSIKCLEDQMAAYSNRFESLRV